MPSKSIQEKERLLMAAQAQSILMQAAIKNKPDTLTVNEKSRNGDTYEPAGEIDYTKYNKAKK